MGDPREAAGRAGDHHHPLVAQGAPGGERRREVPGLPEGEGVLGGRADLLHPHLHAGLGEDQVGRDAVLRALGGEEQCGNDDARTQERGVHGTAVSSVFANSR